MDKMEKDESWTGLISRLYSGLEFEYYVASKLWGLGYEAMKLPIDFGFDLIVYNQKKQTVNKEVPLKKPYLLQVKSCKIQENHIRTEEINAGPYKTYHAAFYFNEKEIERIIEEPTAFVIFVFALDSEPTEIINTVWLNSKQFRQIYEKDNKVHFAADDDKKKLKLTMVTVGAADKKPELIELVTKLNSYLKDKKECGEINELRELSKRFKEETIKKLDIRYKKSGRVRLLYPNDQNRYTLFIRGNTSNMKSADQENLSSLNTESELTFKDDGSFRVYTFEISCDKCKKTTQICTYILYNDGTNQEVRQPWNWERIEKIGSQLGYFNPIPIKIAGDVEEYDRKLKKKYAGAINCSCTAQGNWKYYVKCQHCGKEQDHEALSLKVLKQIAENQNIQVVEII